MPYVQRNQDGAVIGRFAIAQPGIAEEWLDEGHPDLAPTAADQAASLQREIDRLELESLMNRGVRELSLRQMEFMAGQLGEDLETIPAYVKFKALDEQITALREQIWALG
jgi:hypothetical protein